MAQVGVTFCSKTTKSTGRCHMCSWGLESLSTPESSVAQRSLCVFDTYAKVRLDTLMLLVQFSFLALLIFCPQRNLHPMF